MKQFWNKNKFLFAAAAGVLILGLVFFGTLVFWKNGQMKDAGITTLAVRMRPVKAAEQDAEETVSPDSMPVPTPVSPDTAANEVLETEWRFKDVFPRITNIYSYEARTWKKGEPADTALAEKAKEMTIQIVGKYLNRELDPEDLLVERYRDESGYRENVLRITNSKQDFVCCLKEQSLELLSVDNSVLTLTGNPDMQNDAKKLAAFFGSELQEGTFDHGGSQDMEGRWIERARSFSLADGRYFTVSYYKDTLHGIQVHPDRPSMEEMVCFQADIRYDPAVVHLVQAASFAQGDLTDIADGDMTPEEAELFYRTFLSAANSRAVERRKAQNLSVDQLDYNLKDGEMTYFRDESGYRENYYHIEKKGLISMDIAARTGFIVRASCNALYNLDPALDLSAIPYDHMGEDAYYAYMQNIADKVFGTEKVAKVTVNAVYDGNYCTMDIDMKDGSWYEFGFTGGKLMYIEYFATPRIEMAGWLADSLYVNTITGEEFVLEF